MKPTTITLKITGMHCSSCAINIDFELEDIDGVISTTTDYARQQSEVTFYPDKVTPKLLTECISKLGYTAIIQK